MNADFSVWPCGAWLSIFIKPISLMSGMMLLLFAHSAIAEKISLPGKYQGYSEPLYSEYVRSNVFVEARDGVRLAVTLYRPAKNGTPVETPYPAVLAMTPYRRIFQTEDGQIRGEAEANPYSRAMADLTKYGYVVAVADVRGKGASFGVRSGYQDANEARDGYDLVEWLAGQPWVGDAVGMFGCSYVAGTQYATAREAPPHLKAIFVHAGPFDAYQMVRRGGISGQFFTRYQSASDDEGVVPVDSDTDGKLAKQALEQHQANRQMMDLIRTIPYRDGRDPLTDVAYWQLVSPHEYADVFEKSGIAVYHWGNWFDEVADQSIVSFGTLKNNPRKLIMGGGTHCAVESLDSFSEHLRFYDRYLKGIRNGIDEEPPIYFYTINAPAEQAWQFSEKWPPADVKPQQMYLSNSPSETLEATGFDGSLVGSPPRRGEAAYKIDYSVGCIVEPRFMPGIGTPPSGQEHKPQPGYWPCVLDKVGATFTSAPLQNETIVTGTPEIELHLEATVPDFNLFAYLETVSADDKVEIISHGRLRASARKLAAAPYETFGAPWHANTSSDAMPLAPGEPAVIHLALSPMSIQLPAGTRLRLTLSGGDIRQRDLDEHVIDPPPTVRILVGKGRSSLTVPIRK